MRKYFCNECEKGICKVETNFLPKGCLRGDYQSARWILHKKSWDTLLEECLKEIDWEKIHKVMTVLDWAWISNGGGVPSIPDMKLHCSNLVKSSLDRGDKYSLCGGFEVKLEEEEGYRSIEISFVLDSWRAEYDVEDVFDWTKEVEVNR